MSSRPLSAMRQALFENKARQIGRRHARTATFGNGPTEVPHVSVDAPSAAGLALCPGSAGRPNRHHRSSSNVDLRLPLGHGLAARISGTYHGHRAAAHRAQTREAPLGRGDSLRSWSALTQTGGFSRCKSILARQRNALELHSRIDS
jgi:hypothetical protein